MAKGLSYQQAGVNISLADATKRDMAKSMETQDPRVLNRLGAFASLFDAKFPGYEHPVLVLKSEEPGSKQKIALAHGRVESIARDMIHHLIDDIIVMGAEPLSVQDVIVCGKLEKDVVNRLVAAIAAVCREQGCTLTGGETSEQPGVLEPGLYVLTSSIVGVVEKSRIIDGSAIRPGDTVLALASSGLHTNGYSLVRALLARRPALADDNIDGRSFLDAALEPHRCYWPALRDLRSDKAIHGLAHITGGGIAGNLDRVLPPGIEAQIDLSALKIPTLFRHIQKEGDVPDADMLRTFNLGVGITAVVDPAAADPVIAHAQSKNIDCWPIGKIVPAPKGESGRIVRFTNQIHW